MPELAPLLDEFFTYWWRTHPTYATVVGIHTHDGELDRYDSATIAEMVRHSRDYLQAFDRITPSDIEESLDLSLVTDLIRWQLYELEQVRPHTRNPAIYLEAPLSALYVMAVRDYAPAQERAWRAADRMLQLPETLDEARSNLTDASPILVSTAASIARSGVALLNGVLTLNLGSALEDDPEQFSRWDNALRAAEGALVAFADWLETDLAPRAGGDFALGRDAFDARIRYAHGLPYTAEEILAYGLELKATTEAALERLAGEIDGGRPWRELVEVLKGDHPAADELIGAYATEMDRARAFVEERGLVTVPANEELEVTATPDFLRPIIPYAAYLPPGAFEVEQKGYFFVTSPTEGADRSVLRDHCWYGIPVTALHEAYPGHHLQLTLANRTESVPRRVSWTSVFAEGWALYCEEMMWEEGFYTDPRVRLLQLKDLLWRACRVVVDVGLHTRGWSPAEAVDYMVREAGLERSNAEIEVRRYCGDPTQPMSYAVGKREILRLRDRWRERRGPDAPLREFHDRLLSWGTIPPPLIARAMGLD